MVQFEPSTFPIQNVKLRVKQKAVLPYKVFLYIDFFPPNSRALLPIFRTNRRDGSHFAQIGSHFAQITIPNPCSLLSRHTPLSVWGARGEKPSQLALVFKYFRQFMGQALL